MKLTNLLNNYDYTIKLNFIVIFFLYPTFMLSQSQKHYTLEYLQRSAYQKYPYADQLILTKSGGNESIKSVDSKWLPQIAASGKNSYQSEVSAIKIPSNLGITLDPGKKYQYQGELAVSQLIYDGGLSHTSKQINHLTSDIQVHQVENSMLQVENSVDNLFESILIDKEQIKTLNFQKADLESRMKDISSAAQNGISLKSDLQELKAEIIQLKQKKTEIQMQLCELYLQLSSFVQEKIDTSAVFELPQLMNDTCSDYSNRPDFKIFNKQEQNFQYQLKMFKQKELPQLSFFANGYYGQPGINTMNYTPHYSGIVGVSLTWNVSALYNNIHQKRQLNINRQLTQNQRSVYEMEIKRQIDQIDQEIKKNAELIETDDDIVKIRTDVKNVAAIQLKNGTITLTDYLIKLNAESQALVDKSIHRIEWQMNCVKKKTLLNKNN